MEASDESVTVVAGEVSISRRLIDHASEMRDAYHQMLVFEFTASPAEKAAKRAERKARLEAEWDAHPGMVGLQDHSDPECDPEYELVERGDYVTLWTTSEKWEAYKEARNRFDEAAEAL